MATEPIVAGAPRRILRSRGRISGRSAWVVLALFLVPIAMIALKLSGSPLGNVLERTLSLSAAPEELQRRIGSVLFVPLGAVVVVFFRVTLGIRLLGPFRSILLAMAFQVTGVPLGLLFLSIVVGAVLAIRGPIKSVRLPYFARVSVVMSAVAAIIALALVTGHVFGEERLYPVVHFPIVVLCLTADGFARALRREGKRAALFRGVATAAVAVLIARIAGIPGFESALLRFPELLVLETALILVIAEFLGYRSFASLNPAPVRKRRRRRGKKKAAVGAIALATEPGPDRQGATA